VHSAVLKRLIVINGSVFQESHKHVDDADLEAEIQRELEEEEEALRSAWKSRQREQSAVLHALVNRRVLHCVISQ